MVIIEHSDISGLESEDWSKDEWETYSVQIGAFPIAGGVDVIPTNFVVLMRT